MDTSPSYVAYYRVSTSKQGLFGLGMAAQRQMVRAAIEGRGQIVAEYSEIGNSTRVDRPVLRQALAACEKHRATLIVAKLDRLARNAAFFSALMDSEVQFVVADMPFANRVTLHVMAALAEYEHDMMSARARDAIARAKARGVKFGARWHSPEEVKRRVTLAGAGHAAKADKFALQVFPIISRFRRMGVKSWRRIALALESSGVPTAQGGKWSGNTVRLIEERAKYLRACVGAKPGPREPEVGVVAMIRKMKESESMSYRQIARTLNLRGVRNARGRTWDNHQVSSVLRRL